MLTENQLTDFFGTTYGRKPLPGEYDAYKGYDLNQLGSMPDPTYANVKGPSGITTVFNKKTGKPFATPQELAADMGIDPSQLTWDKYKFDTTYDPTRQPYSITPQQDPTFDFQKTYNDQLSQLGAPQAKTDMQNTKAQVDQIDKTLLDLLNSKKQQVTGSGGIVDETQLQAEVAQEKQPLLIQRASLVNSLQTATANYNDILKQANTQVTAAEKTFSDKLAGQRVAITAANDLMTKITGGNLDPSQLDPQQLAQLEKNAGLPAGTIANLAARANFVAHSFQTDNQGNVTFIGVDKTGNVTTQKVGSVGKTKTASGSSSGSGSGVSATSDAKAIADAIISGNQPPDLKGLYGKSAAVRAELQRQGYNLTKATEDWTATQKFLSSANSSTQLRLQQAVRFSSDSLSLVDSLNQKAEDALHRSGITKFAEVKKSLALQGIYGQEVKSAFTQLDNQISDLTSELATVYKGGNSSTNEGLTLAARQLNSNWDFKTLQDDVKLVRQNLQIRINSISSSTVSGVTDNSYAPSNQVPAPAGSDINSVKTQYNISY